MQDQVRDSGKQPDYSHQLPIELWLVIAEHFREGASAPFRLYSVRSFNMYTIKILRLVSRAFDIIFEPLFWERVALIGTGTGLERAKQIKEHFSRKPRVRQFVKCLVFTKWRQRPSAADQTPERKNNPLADVLTEIFTKLHNLRAVHGFWSQMSGAMYEHLYRLQYLEYLEFMKLPTIPFDLSPRMVTLSSNSLRIKAIAVSMGVDSTQAGLQAHKQLFLSPALEQISTSTSMAPFIYAMADQQIFYQLQTYDALEPFELDEFDAFYSFAARCPNLTCVKFRSRITEELNDVDRIPAPPEGSLSRLRSFEGSLQLSARIVPRQPVEKVVVPVSSNSMSESAFETWVSQLSRSTTPIITLHFTIRYLKNDFLSVISSYHPSLEELRIHFAPRIVPNATQVSQESDFGTLSHRVEMSEFCSRTTFC